jgi:hypothetical protein
MMLGQLGWSRNEATYLDKHWSKKAMSMSDLYKHYQSPRISSNHRNFELRVKKQLSKSSSKNYQIECVFDPWELRKFSCLTSDTADQ